MTDDTRILAPDAIGGLGGTFAPGTPFSRVETGKASTVGEAWRWTTERSRLRLVELVIAAVSFVVVAVSVYLPHLLRGSFYADDWGNAGVYQFAHGSRFLHLIQVQRDTFGTRPLLWVDKGLLYTIFGMHARQQLIFTVVLTALVAVAFFALLRMLGLARLHSFAIAGLTLLFPWGDSTRLWATAGVNELAVLLYLLGTVAAFLAFDQRGRRAFLVHAASVLFYAAALLTYEAVAGLIVMNALLYWVRARRGHERAYPILRRWLVDCAVLVIVLAFSASSAAPGRPAPGIRAVLGDALPFSVSAAGLVVRTLSPIGPIVLGLAVIAGIAMFAWRRGLPEEADARHQLSRWCGVAALAIVAAVFAFAPLSGSGLHPLSQGIDNRGNIAVALPLCAFVYAVVAIVTRLLVPRRRAGRDWVVPVGAALLLLIGAGYVYELGRDMTHWDRAATLQNQVLAVVRHTVAPSSSHNVIYAYGAPAYVSPGVVVFATPWDLDGAAKITLGNGTVHAYPVAQGVELVCGATGVYPRSDSSNVIPDFGPAYRASYGKAIFVDVARNQSEVVSNAAACNRLKSQMQLAPAFGSSIG